MKRQLYAYMVWAGGVLMVGGQTALGTPTNEDILRSFNENMDQTPDYSRLIPWFFAVLGIIAVVMFMRQRQKRQAVPRALNHPGKLMREIVRGGEIDPVEMKRLSAKAKELNCENPLTLLLCPSLLAPAGEPAAPSAEPDHSNP